jgi:hypothetical protein
MLISIIELNQKLLNILTAIYYLCFVIIVVLVQILSEITTINMERKKWLVLVYAKLLPYSGYIYFINYSN